MNGEGTIAHAHGIKIKELRKLGGMLKETERHPPGPDKEDRSPGGTDLPPTLSDLGITKKTSADAQKLAAMSDEEVQAIADRERSISQVLR